MQVGAGDVGLIPGSGRSPGGGSGNPLQYSCLGNPMDRGAFLDTVHGVAKSRTRLGTHTRTRNVFEVHLCAYFSLRPDWPTWTPSSLCWVLGPGASQLLRAVLCLASQTLALSAHSLIVRNPRRFLSALFSAEFPPLRIPATLVCNLCSRLLNSVRRTCCPESPASCTATWKVSPCRNAGWSQRPPHAFGFSWGSQWYVPIVQGLKRVFPHILSSFLVLYKHKGRSVLLIYDGLSWFFVVEFFH